MTRLFIAEKPNLGRAIATALPKPHKKEQGFIRCGDGDVATWHSAVTVLLLKNFASEAF